MGPSWTRSTTRSPIHRLSDDEIREVMKLVKLIGDFPYVV
jgi:hypothetical protein